MDITLTRDDQNDSRTLGRIEYDGKRFECLELPWRDNKRSVSCIPPGRYEVRITPSRAFMRKLPILLDVPGRDGIRIHRANYPTEIRGCIAPGRARGPNGVSRSAECEREIQADIQAAIDKNEKVWIEIKERA